MLVHRAAYEIEHGPIPHGAQIHHVCGNKLCINPEHLQVARTAYDHFKLDARGIAHENSLKTSCKRGHPFDDENTRWLRRSTKGRRWMRICVTCHRESNRKWRERRRRET